MQHTAQNAGMVMTAAARMHRAMPQERWPAPLATLFIGGSSLALWSGIYLAARAMLG